MYRPDWIVHVATGAVSHDLSSGTLVSGLDPGLVYAEGVNSRAVYRHGFAYLPGHGPEPEAKAQLRLELTGRSGGLRLVNAGPKPVMIWSAIAVEKEQGPKGVAVVTEFHAVAECIRQPAADRVKIEPGATLVVVPWRGFSCSGQCNASCRANVYYGPGTFRFVVTTVPDGQRFTSPTFRLSANPPLKVRSNVFGPN
jgi:hypothetical protein